MTAEKGKSEAIAYLVRPREDVVAKIQEMLAKGAALRECPLASAVDLRAAKEERHRWAGSTAEFLRNAFSNSSIAQEFTDSRRLSLSRSDAPLGRQVEDFRLGLDTKLNTLRSLLGRVEWMGTLADTARVGISVQADEQRNLNVFVVHGHDEAAKDMLAAFLRKLGLQATILDEVPSAGRTVIEKFEQTASKVGYAVVLLTPDDEGALKGADELSDRARQNVTYELGYFTGTLGRGRVCLLKKGNVEIPSDLSGVVYVSLDKGDWQQKLAGEMRVAGIPIDANKLLGV